MTESYLQVIAHYHVLKAVTHKLVRGAVGENKVLSLIGTDTTRTMPWRRWPRPMSRSLDTVYSSCFPLVSGSNRVTTNTTQ